MSENEVEGKSFAFTGSLGFPRRELRKEVESRGGIYHARVTRETDYLVIGRVYPHQGTDGKTKKMMTARRYQELGCHIRSIDPADFMLLLVCSQKRDVS